MIATFYFLSDSDALMDKYPNIVLIMSLLVFFFNKKIVCMSFVSAFIANTSNFIIKFMMCFFLCLNVLIFHLVSTALLLLLNCYKLKILGLIKRKNLVLGLTQENLIENSVQDSLPYILNSHGLC